MMASKKMAVLSLLTFFLLGTGFGLLLDRSVLRPGPPKFKDKGGPHHKGDFLFDMFTQELGLTTTQQDSLRVMLAELRNEFEIAGKQYFERAEEIRKQFGRNFEQILDDKQKEKYREMVAKFEKDRKEFEKRQRPPR